ncbi:hypothetical protein SERLA73DRAFT_105481 [Serpula lacrymans var. lacrymans S7.3]|uniref:Major facilitator superfamily (MFS) profile domain-containing protein n=2 Tax=Serpula lacrymans var. lacrymans TaxID=341189 RepID=F8PTF3_SERL3|nr:uncharacterized protein SERLADRAFT_463837 [Serpula lacrymans var. lacrymans S7.9]EGO00981.1 hypothetical protein SERLA73DRAFT_105481 [Serpula lacrymans var. lacrymans S7.3]EGO26616.1 hypothetical protein SERLADRAFT_463837 [Serpula lacrymans var. lacrymans S7.9]
MSNHSEDRTITATPVQGCHETLEKDHQQLESQQAPVSAAAPPDGGMEAWLTVAGACMINFCTFGYINAFGVYQDYYTRVLLSDRTASDISWIGSFQLFMLYAPGALVGKAFDAGYFHHLSSIGIILYVFSMFMLSLVQPGQYYQIFLSHGVGMGIGQGLLYVPSLSIVAHHFKRRRALATGIVVSGASAGGIIFPIMLNILFAESGIGFANGVRASAALVAGLLFIAKFLMKTRPPPKMPSSTGSTGSTYIKDILTDGAYIWSIAGAFLVNVGMFFPFFYLELFSTAHNISDQLAFYSLAMLNAGSLVGRVIPTFLADRIGVYNMLLPSIFMSAVTLFGLIGANNTGSVYALAVLFGFSSGAYVSLIPSLLATLCRHMGEIGIRIGIAFSVVAVAMLIGTPVNGAILGRAYSWNSAIIFSGICISAGLILMVISRVIFVRRKRNQQD